jgi:hypothetical protein
MELQESDTQTPFVFNKVAETQSTIHPVAKTQEPATDIEVELQELETPDAAAAETQEPATDFEIEEIKTQDAVTPPSSSKTTENLGAVTQEPVTDVEIEFQESQDAATPPSSSNMAERPATHSVAETQEPPTDMEIDMQESEVEAAETLLSLHQEAETQASVSIPVAVPQEPAKETMTATQEPVISKSKSTMTDVLEENEFLKSQLEAYQQELVRAREAYEKELSRYALERTTILAAQTTESICKEYMCCQCGDIYYRAGYKITQVPVPGAVPPPSPFEVKPEPAVTQEAAGSIKLKTKPAATQEPAGLSKFKTEPAETQQLASSSRIKKEAPTVVNKAMKTVPIEEITPPSQINLSTSREQSTQTMPNPTTCHAETQTSHLWDEHTEIQKWKKEYAET